MKLRTGTPWISGADYGHTLKGLSINLLVRDVAGALRFAERVLQAKIVYSDPDFAVLQACGSEWMLHADHCYDRHPMREIVAGDAPRGAGIEIRLHGLDPDQAVQRALALGYKLLAPAADKPHGVREAYLVDADGYVWVPDVPI